MDSNSSSVIDSEKMYPEREIDQSKSSAERISWEVGTKSWNHEIMGEWHTCHVYRETVAGHCFAWNIIFLRTGCTCYHFSTFYH